MSFSASYDVNFAGAFGDQNMTFCGSKNVILWVHGSHFAGLKLSFCGSNDCHFSGLKTYFVLLKTVFFVV